jgi:hypothetical protein
LAWQRNKGTVAELTVASGGSCRYEQNRGEVSVGDRV